MTDRGVTMVKTGANGGIECILDNVLFSSDCEGDGWRVATHDEERDWKHRKAIVAYHQDKSLINKGKSKNRT